MTVRLGFGYDGGPHQYSLSRCEINSTVQPQATNAQPLGSRTDCVVCDWGAAGWALVDAMTRIARIRVGLLHSATGEMAISEKPLIDAEVLASKKSIRVVGFSAGRLTG